MKTLRKPTIAGQLHFTTPYEKKQLSTGILFSGQAYQRKVRPARVKQIMDEFDPKLLDEVIVSYRSGQYNVVDGQHRIAALKAMNGGADVMVTCKVASGLTYEQEADLYERLDASKKRLSVADSTRAKVEANNDPEIQNIKKVLKANGLIWSLKNGGGYGGNNRVASARTLLNAYSLLGLDGFAQMIRLIKTTWGGEAKSLNSYILSGMSLFVKTYGQEIQEETFVKKLSRVSPSEIITEGKSDISTREMALKYARVIRNKYNYKARENALSYKFNG